MEIKMVEHNNKLSQLVRENMKVVLLDIEGTTTAITFVSETLFPYAKLHLKDYLQDNWHNDQVLNVVSELKIQSEVDKSKYGIEVPQIITTQTRSQKDNAINSVVEYVKWQMSLNQKTIALKKLQGYIWRDGYHNKEIVGHVYKDVKHVLEQLKKMGKRLCIYSSGSVEAQKLLFGHTCSGNMLSLFGGNYDTKFGDKRSASSYKKIAECIGCSLQEILFLTDIEEEAVAAIESGMHACIVVRPGNKLIDKIENYHNITSFTSLIGS
uniref:Enolase-phosphatase E1-like n=1 Tax=Phallusia mammillata TaxID=59560 RepID=A0A6F9DBB1_9ASCI|nr:enolase-phosphatase E1-like [Phallusia mammillata]